LIPYNSGATDLSGNSATDVVGSIDIPWCVRLKISFSDMPGDIASLSADVSDVTFLKKTNLQHGLTSTDVTKLMLRSRTVSVLSQTTGPSATPSMKGSYLKPYTNQVSDSATVSSGTPSTITFTGDPLHTGAAGTYYPGEKVKVECEYDDPSGGSVKVWRNLGTYTVSDPSSFTPAATMDKNILTVDEYVLACDSTGSGKYKVTSVSHVVSFGDVDITKIQDLTSVTESDNIRLEFETSAGDVEFDAVVTDARYYTGDAVAATVYAASLGYVIIGEEDPSGSLGPGSTGEGRLDGSTYVTTIKIAGDGTMENTECGDRGICQEDGTCKCFQGYTGDSCSTQKSIAM